MSSNHTIRLYREDDKRWHCGVKNCLNEATHVCEYTYDDMGDFPRTSRNDRCREHAQKFRQRHNAKYISRWAE